MNHAVTSRASRGKAHSVAKDYLDLVRVFPLRPLRSQKEHGAALAILDRMVGRDDLSPGEVDYVAALVRFVEDYEQQHRLGQLRRLMPLELLRHLMEENEMSTSDLGYILGSRGLASEVLHGKRGLSKMLIRKLAEHFGVDPALFLDPTVQA